MTDEETVAGSHHGRQLLADHHVRRDAHDVRRTQLGLVEDGGDVLPDDLGLLADQLRRGAVRSNRNDSGRVEPSGGVCGQDGVGILGCRGRDRRWADDNVHVAQCGTPFGGPTGRTRQRRRPVEACNHERVRKYVVMGVQGSGKGTQARRLADDFELEHIEVGDVFRWNVQHHTKLGARVRRDIDAGDLVGDDVVEQIVQDRLEAHDWNYGFVIDGFPRTERQASFFLERYDIDAVVHLVMPDTEVEARVLARRVCTDCGLDYNLMSHRPTVEHVCDLCGGALVARDDDTPEALAQRLRDYRERTEPAIALFAAKERVVDVDATRSKDEVYAEICRSLGLGAGRTLR